jgi:UDP-N-acetylglucosamine 2-epimerase (non-hydrolysing)
MKVMSVVGARPNFMKVAPVMRVGSVQHVLVHTGQHYDDSMSRAFFEELEIPEADYNLGVGSGSPGWQLGESIKRLEEVIEQEDPDWVVVYGDVNAAPAATIAAKRGGFRVAHVEAGLRSFDKSMPEEMNRIIADRFSDLLLAPDETAMTNLRRENVWGRAAMVGNVMVDTLERERLKAEEIELSSIAPVGGPYTVVTVHRPSNVDGQGVLRGLLEVVGREAPGRILLPLHPRTKRAIELKRIDVSSFGDFVVLPPLGYRQMLRLNMSASLFVTDSGGLQEECCVLGTPCVVVRENTERPVTQKVCVLAGSDPEQVAEKISTVAKRIRRPYRPDKWDGRTAERIVEELLR